MNLLLRRSVVVGFIVLCVGPIAACSDDGPRQGEARLELDGQAAVERQNGDDETLTSDDRLRFGDRIAVEKGDAVLHLPNGTTLELRVGRGDSADTVVVLAPQPVLVAGDLLVITDDEITVKVADTNVTVTDGAARVSRGVGLNAGSYTAEVLVDSAGVTRDVGELRQLSVAALGQPPASPSPLLVDSADPWDRRFLGNAIDLGLRLEAVSNGFTANLRNGEGGTVAFFAGVLPGLAGEPELGSVALDPDRPAGETLIGAAIADLGEHGTFAQRWRSVFAFRDAGADWGLVAADQRVESAPLIASVTAAVVKAPLDTATTRPGGSAPAAPTTETPEPVPGTGSPAPPSPTTTAPPPKLPSKPDEPGPLDPILDPLLMPVTDVLNSLIGGLLGGLGGG